jgi:hypothetical protein
MSSTEDVCIVSSLSLKHEVKTIESANKERNNFFFI